MVHQIGAKLRGQIRDFSGKLCSEMGKVVGRFVEEMVYGIQARGSVRLSEIARSLVERTSVKKRIDRLSRNLARKGLGSDISAGILAEGAGRIEQKHASDCRSDRHNQEICEENGVPRQG